MTDVVGEALAGHFALELPECRLVQCGRDNSTVYKGSGFVDQLPDGTLRLRMHAKCSVSQSKRLSNAFNGNFKPGKVLGEDHYYDLTARDMHGHEWSAKRQTIKENSGLGDVVYSDLTKLTRRNASTAAGWFCQWHVLSDLDLPWNATTELPNGGWRLDRFIHDDPDYAWTVHKTATGVKIDFGVKACEDSERHAKDFLWALSILAGKPLQPIVSQTRDGEYVSTHLHRPAPLAKNTLLHPLAPARLNEPSDYTRFLRCCLDHGTTHDVDPSPLRVVYQFWHRIQAAYEKDVENSALVLSVAVEGLLKALYLCEHDADATLLPQLDEATKVLKTLVLGDRARAILASALGNARKATPTGVLYRLCEQEVIAKEHVDAWKRLRNTGAHGELLEDDPVAFQTYMDTYWVCLDLFYLLALLAIRYRGSRTDYASDGWPVFRFPPETVDQTAS